MERALWQQCLDQLREELSAEDYNMWIQPLQVRHDESQLTILAPNRYVQEQVSSAYLNKIRHMVGLLTEPTSALPVQLEVGSLVVAETDTGIGPDAATPLRTDNRFDPVLNRTYTFDNFVEGKANELARAAASQAAKNAGASYNPLLLYGGVGLGKTHLMNAVGNEILAQNPDAKVVYLHSQRFVQDMVQALQTGTMQSFVDYYKGIDALLIDDIQFFANKLRSQEEFFHVFNALLETDRQMVLTCDRYPREIDGLEERLQSRFVWGLTVEVGQPDLETRVAILMKKAELDGVVMGQDVAFYIAERVRSNVRELEGALRRVEANACLLYTSPSPRDRG